MQSVDHIDVCDKVHGNGDGSKLHSSRPFDHIMMQNANAFHFFGVERIDHSLYCISNMPPDIIYLRSTVWRLCLDVDKYLSGTELNRHFRLEFL